MSVDNSKDDEIRICSVYALASLTKNEMLNIRDLFAEKGNATVFDMPDLKEQPEQIVSPDEIGGAGRVNLSTVADKSIPASLIFSTSVPFDVMASVEVNHSCNESDCLAHCLEFVEAARNEFSALQLRYDVESVTIVGKSNRNFITNSGNLQLTVFHRMDEVIVYSAPYPYDFYLIASLSEDKASQAQAILQNLYRIRGGVQHLNRILSVYFREDVLPLRKKIVDYVESARNLSARRQLRLIKPLRNQLFDLQAKHSSLMAEFESLLEYETLYLRESSLSTPLPQKLVDEIKNNYLQPLKLKRDRINASFRDDTKYLTNAIQALYADINLNLALRMRTLTYVQAIVAVVLVVFTVVQVITALT